MKRLVRERLISTSRRLAPLAALLGIVALMSSGCLVVPPGPYGRGPAVVAPAPVVVAPAPRYVWGWHYHYWR